ncbi:Ger(x)C family spore germination protein [Bacillus sp. ISL-40]|uniref:Ger(x)C family spore germination protein n=1 Tax=unclassified Bacillus (in: firmicutes) TaxID=185979 RepID=UPI001BE8CF07|nr:MULTISPECIES: Ger(x)C family spore germination protein [unclassified Bacillus (in: firmicutes)]MBT2700844.1 Ger(x)C family spore germination protein [Bacillus sp. ISL-40]MBT2725100.1 Ger(x)C family spore germination protein [Bacillus sp. ISL-46]MBT2744392.1 Ger(x)C family spore germination protein [Bacillus sp. ISL-77]
MNSIVILFTLTGCWNRVELNELAVTVAMGLDKKGNQILLSHQIVNPGAIAAKGGAASSDTPVTLFHETGNSLQEAGRRLTTSSTRKVYTGQLQMLIISEELAKEGLSDILDHISRDHQYRRDFFVVIARGTKAENILKVYTLIDRIPARKMNRSLENSSDAWGVAGTDRMDQFMSDIIDNGKEAVLTGIKVRGKRTLGETMENGQQIDPGADLEYNGLAVFKNDRLVGWLNEEASKGYNYTQGEISSTSVVFPCPQGKKKMTVEVLRTQEETQFKKINGIPKIDVKISLEGNVADAQCDIDLSKPETITQLEKLTEKDIERTIAAALKAAQKKYKSDIFGFGDVINRTNPKYWEKLKKDWDQEFPDLQVNVEVKADIRGVFLTKKSFRDRMEE